MNLTLTEVIGIAMMWAGAIITEMAALVYIYDMLGPIHTIIVFGLMMIFDGLCVLIVGGEED